MNRRSALRVRPYGSQGPLVVVLHGGPGAPGYMAPLARELADSFRVLEPLQRGSGGPPLTVGAHVADLDALIEACGAGERPALVGHSWGAMLALAYAAKRPGRARSLVLVGCGTFDTASRAQLQAALDERMGVVLRRRMEDLAQQQADHDERLRALGNLLLPLYSCEPTVSELELEACDARAHDETWQDMLRLQGTGVYPAVFAAIDVPVLMLHGAADPHPGQLIRASLERHLPRLEYREWQHCGHYPWLERRVRAEFLGVLREWLVRPD